MIVELLTGWSLTTILLTLLCAFLLSYWLWRIQPEPPGLPPGHRGLRAIQKHLLPILSKTPPELSAMKNAKENGPIYSFYLWTKLGVTLGDYDSIRKAFVDQGEAFSGRVKNVGHRLDETDVRSILAAEGQFWKEHRRFALTALRNFGIGKASIEPKILDELSYFLKAVEDKRGDPFDITELLAMSICNNICLLEFGHRFEYTDPRFIQLRRSFDDRKKLGVGPILKILFPFLPYVPGMDGLLKIDQFKKLLKETDDLVNEEISEHYKNYRPGSCDDYIDAYFTERALREKENRNSELFDDVTLRDNLEIFFLAGTDTILTTLRWMFYFLMTHPDVQMKIQKEIDDMIGRDRQPSYDDKPRMPFTEATIFETHRRGSIVPLNLPHKTLEDVKLNGYNIPKDTIITSNLFGVHHDPSLYPDPYTFRPERFINDQGQAVKPDWLMPFSLGKRFCLGEPLARMELFLYLTCILQKFTLNKVEGDVLTDEVSFMTRELKPYNMMLIPRD